MKDQEEFEQLRLQSYDEIATTINQRKRHRKNLKKIKKEAFKNMIDAPLLFIQQASSQSMPAEAKKDQSPKGMEASPLTPL